jgi:hypothetical protein
MFSFISQNWRGKPLTLDHQVFNLDIYQISFGLSEQQGPGLFLRYGPKQHDLVYRQALT